MKTEGGFVNWKVISAKSCASPIPIPASGLEIPLLLKFSCHGQVTFEKEKTLVKTLYDYNFAGKVTDNSIVTKRMK